MKGFIRLLLYLSASFLFVDTLLLYFLSPPPRSLREWEVSKQIIKILDIEMDSTYYIVSIQETKNSEWVEHKSLGVTYHDSQGQFYIPHSAIYPDIPGAYIWTDTAGYPHPILVYAITVTKEVVPIKTPPRIEDHTSEESLPDSKSETDESSDYYDPLQDYK